MLRLLSTRDRTDQAPAGPWLGLLSSSALLLATAVPQAQAAVDHTENNRITRSRGQGTRLFTPGDGRVPVISGRSNTVTVTGDWLDITNRAEFVRGSSRRNLNFSTGKNNGRPFVRVTMPSDLANGRATLRLSRLGGSDEVRLRVVPNVVVSSVEVLSPRTGNISYENAFKVNDDFIIRVNGTNVDAIGLLPGALQLSNVVINGVPTATRKEFLVRSANTSDRVDIDEDSLTVTFPDVRLPRFNFIFYDNIGTHVYSNREFAFFRIYDNPYFRVSNVRNKFLPSATNIENCDRIVDPANGSRVINRQVTEGAERIISRFRLANPTAEQPQVTKEVTWPNIRFTISNASYAPAPAFQAEVKFGLTQVATINIPRMIARSSATVSFRRAVESRKIFARHVACPGVYEILKAPFDWTDPAYTLILDPANTLGNGDQRFDL